LRSVAVRDQRQKHPARTGEDRRRIPIDHERVAAPDVLRLKRDDRLVALDYRRPLIPCWKLRIAFLEERPPLPGADRHARRRGATILALLRATLVEVGDGHVGGGRADVLDADP